MVELPVTNLIFLKGKWYVNCTIPADLRPYFKGQKQRRRSTRTADRKVAETRQHGLASEIYREFAEAKPHHTNEVWQQLKSNLAYVPLGMKDATPEDLSAEDLQTLEALATHPVFVGDPEEDMSAHIVSDEAVEALAELKDLIAPTVAKEGVPLLSVALKRYLDEVPFDRAKTRRDVELSIERVIEFMGDVSLEELNPPRLQEFAVYLDGTGAAHQTIAKRIVYLKGLYKHAVNSGWITTNTVRDFTLSPKLGSKGKTWRKLENDDLERLFDLKMPEHVRRLFAILTTTGMRLDEAALLNWEDIKTEGGIRCFDLTHIDAILKNTGSARKVPVPKALKGLLSKGGSGPMFPQFKRDADGKASTAASKVLMPYVRKITDDKQKVVHSLRGSLKDMLRDAKVDKEINDFITGHGSGDVAGTYGSGPSLSVRKKALDSVDHPWLKTC